MQSVVELPNTTPILPSQVKKWILIILVHCGGIKNLENRYGGPVLSEALGLEGKLDPEHCDFDKKQTLQALRLMLQRTGQEQNNEPVSQLTLNLKKLKELVGLSRVEIRLLEFAIMIKHEPALESVASALEEISYNKLLMVLTTVLHASELEVRTALSPEGLLGSVTWYFAYSENAQATC